MAYIELNMVRAGAVKHPKDWEFCGYNEILDPPRRYRLIDRTALLSSCGITDPDEFRTYYEELVAHTLQHGTLRRESLWTNNLAVGSRQYIEQNQDKFGRQHKIKALPASVFKINQPGQIRVKNDSNSRGNGGIEDYVIKESQFAYDAYFTLENWALRGENSVFWNDFSLTTDA
jgi:putative transposase